LAGAPGPRRTPVIALTANAMTHQVNDLLACGMDLHVAKPIDAAALFGAIEAALDMAEAATETA
jgi:CheY-like chemotaxis protein